MNPAMLVSLILMQVVHAASSKAESLKMPEDIQGVSLGMSGAELVAARPALKVFAVGIDDDPDESPQEIDFNARREVGLFEKLPSTSPFGQAAYSIFGGTVSMVFLIADITWPDSEVFRRRPRAISDAIRRWGRPTCRVVEQRILHGKRANVPTLIWRLREAVITLSVPADDIPESMAAVVYGMEIRPASNVPRPGGPSADPEAKLSKKARKRICDSLGLDKMKAE